MWSYYVAIISCYFFVIAFGGFMVFVSTNSSDGQISGLEMMAFILAFVVFVSGYGENARFAMQNGSTRKAVFQAAMLNLVINCAGLSLVTQIGTLINGVVSHSGGTLFAGLSTAVYGVDQGLTAAIFTNFVFTFAVMAASGMFGIFLAAIFARLGKNGRVILAICVPVFIFVMLPIITGYLFMKVPDFMMAVADFLYTVLGLKSGNPYIGSLTFIIGAAIVGVLAYLVNRKMEIK